MLRDTAGEDAQPAAVTGVAVDAGAVAVVDVGTDRDSVVDVDFAEFVDAARAPSSDPPHDATATARIASSAQSAITRATRVTEVMVFVRFFIRALDDLHMKLSSSARHSCMMCDTRVTTVTGRAPTSQ